jgi:cell division septation protein DedD
VREERPAAEPAVTTAAPAPPERALPTVPPQKPAPAAVAVAPSTTTEVRPASALTGAPVSAARAPARSSEGAAPSRAAAPIATPTVAADGEFRIQLAAVRGEADARRAWSLFMGDLGPVLSDIKPIFERADTANGVFYRVQIGPFANQQAAESLCEELKQRNASCFVIRR